MEGAAMTAVPCDGCVMCCIGDAVRLLPGDNPDDYRTEPHPFVPGALMLAHTAGGSCIYLGRDGCTIHERKPQMCREMDCRVIAERFSFTQARKLHGFPLRVWRRGRDLRRAGKERRRG